MKKKVPLILGSAGLAFLVAWLVAEIVVRSVFPYWDLSMALKYSPSLFSRHVITRTEQTVHKRANPSDTLTINERGYRGRSIKQPKPEGQIRIIIYGGSQVFSAGTGRKSWPRRVEDTLRENGYDTVRVINAGTPGHASFDSFGRLYSYGHALDPDFVILNNAWNDIKYFHIRKTPLTEARPYNPSRNPRRNYLSSLDRFLGQRSQFYLFLRTKYFSWGRYPRRSDDFYRPEKTARISESALNQYRLTVGTFIDFSEKIGAEPILMKQPRLLTKDLPDKYRRKIRFGNQNLTPEATLRAFGKINGILEEQASTSGVELLDFSEMNGVGEYFYDHVHLTPAGARKLSDMMARKLAGEMSGRE